MNLARRRVTAAKHVHLPYALPPWRPAPRRARGVAVWIAIAAITLLATAMRFHRTAQAPPGFYQDEAAISAQVLCLAQSGRTLDGARWPLMTAVLGGGYSTIAWDAPAVAWVSMDGNSIGALRRLAALCGALTVVGVFFAGFFATGSKQIAAYAALSAAVSPWAFQFSRMAWDPAIAPLYLTWALASLFGATTARAIRTPWLSWVCVASSALFFAAACICYPPLRVQVPLIVLGAFAWKREYVRAHLRESVVFVAVFLVCTAKLWMLTRSGAIQGRFETLSVFAASYWTDQGVTSRGGILFHGALLFVKNMAAHFSPRYLFVSGDANLRHSTQAFGEWSWFDIVALAGAAAAVLPRRRLPTRWVIFLLFGYLAGICPAALTWEGVPHALRSIGALPFLCLLVGTGVKAIADRPRIRRFVPIAACVVALTYEAAFLPVFFVDYPDRAGDAFDAPIVAELRQPQAAQLLADAERAQSNAADADAYPSLALRYYELRDGAVQCGPDNSVIPASAR